MSSSRNNSINTAREQFIKNQWLPYPDAVNFKTAGRVVLLTDAHLTLYQGVLAVNSATSRGKSKAKSIEASIKASNDKINNQSNHKSAKKNHKKIAVKTIKNWLQWSRILIPGDIICISKNNHCVLLAPNLLDYNWNCQHAVSKIARQHNWNKYLNVIVQFFEARHFLAVDTPILVDNPGSEPTIDVFKIAYKNGRSVQDKYLITSPELNLKKIVSETLMPVYEITNVFRNNEHSSKHRPEFCMLEWYRPFSTLEDIKKDVQDLVLFLVKKFSIKNKKLLFKQTSFSQILKACYNFEFNPLTSADQLKQCLRANNIYFSNSMTLDDLFSLVTLELVEPKIDSNQIVFLNDYPPYAAALAKIDLRGWAQRFEVYWQDLELGNAFYELNDPVIQKQRFVEDNLKKKQNKLDELPMDQSFINSLQLGLPPTAGISIGLERLYMALFNQIDIDQIK